MFFVIAWTIIVWLLEDAWRYMQPRLFSTHVASRSHAFLNLRAEPRTFSITHMQSYIRLLISREGVAPRGYIGCAVHGTPSFHFPGLRDTLSISGMVGSTNACGRMTQQKISICLWLRSWSTNQLTSGVSACTGYTGKGQSTASEYILYCLAAYIL